jgi:hypothetical protein
MLAAPLFALTLAVSPATSCATAEVARADADLVIAQKLYVDSRRPAEKKLALALVHAALERKRTAVVACTPIHSSPKHSPFDEKPDPFDEKPDPFDVTSCDSESAWLATQQVVAEALAGLEGLVRP